jgi:predicted negative regulator of RcsB-dependent stress response
VSRPANGAAAWSLVPFLGALFLAGCAYYNGLWSANRLAKDARKFEERGMVAEARLNWGRAAAKAETVLVHHPHSRWADDALVLQGEGLAKSGTCDAAIAPLNRAIATVTDDALRERANLAAATCALKQGSIAAAERYLTPVLESHDAGRRSTAA